MPNFLSDCSQCCEDDSARQQQGVTDLSGQAFVRGPAPAPVSQRVEVVGEEQDRTRATALEETTERQWVAVTAYQPIDTVTKVVEVPTIKTVQRFVPKTRIEEKIVEVPKYIPKVVEKFVEVPEVKFVDKVIEVPEYQYQYKYVPKIETRENIIETPRVETKYVERVVEIPQVKEVVRYEEVEAYEEVIKYVGKDAATGELDASMVAPPTAPEAGGPQAARPEWPTVTAPVGSAFVTTVSTTAPPQGLSTSYEMPAGMTFSSAGQYAPPPQKMSPLQKVIPAGVPPPIRTINGPAIEQVFVPNVVKNVEIQKHVPISVDVPVPYMVPKPVVVPVQVPVLKFRDHFVPVPVRRRVVPRIRWTNEIFEVECIKEKPFLQVQDVIKPVACDVEIRVHEFVQKAAPINPTELSQADVHAMWMRVNADLAEQRKAELGEDYPSVRHPEGTVFGQPKATNEAEEGEEGGIPTDPEASGDSSKSEAQAGAIDVTALHPGHPLSTTYLQNEWIKKDTTSTQQMYSPEWFEAHQKAMYSLTTQHPTQVQLSPEQAATYTDAGAAQFQHPTQMQLSPGQTATDATRSGTCRTPFSSCSSCCDDSS